MACLSVSVAKTRLVRNVINGLLGWTKIVTGSPLSSSSSSRLLTTSVKMQIDVGGIYPPIVTPFDADETIAYDKLQQNMDKWNKIPFRGYVVQGSNGEYVYLREDERVELVRRVSEMAGPGKLVIAGAGCESTRDTILMCKKMAEAGAKAVLVVTPCFYKGLMTNDVLLSHFTKVADASPVPVILYSVPGNTGIDLAAEVVVELSRHPNIVAVKDSGGDIAKIGYMVHATKGNDFQVLAGSASFLLASYTVGGVGGVLALANILGEQCCEVERLFKAGKMEEAKLLQHRLIAPNIMVTKKLGVPGLKKAMEMLGYFGGPNRSPLQAISKQGEESLRTVLTNEGFL